MNSAHIMAWICSVRGNVMRLSSEYHSVQYSPQYMAFLKSSDIEAPRRKQRGMFCRAAEPTGNALAVAVQRVKHSAEIV